MEGHLGGQILIVLILILINAFFASAEIAVISLNEAKLRHDAEEGDKKARRLLPLVKDPTYFLSTIQLAITLAGFMASAFAADSFSDQLVGWLLNVKGIMVSESLLNTVCLILITVLLSYVTLVLGELVPKRLAMAKSEQVTKLTVGTVITTGKIFTPFIKLLTVSTNTVLRLLKIDPNQENNAVSEEEIRLMVDIGEEKGAIESAEAEMIDNIFEFNNITAEDVMIHRKEMVSIWLDDDEETIIQRIKTSGLSRFPVLGEDIDDICGILRTKEYLLNLQSKHPKALKDLLAPAYLVPEQVNADVLFRDMQHKKEHMAIVVDEYGGTSGLVTLEDLLEEIVGNIYDEFDPQEEKEIEQLSDDTWRVSGSCEIDYFCETLDIDLPEETDEEFDTVGGLIFSAMNEIPADGSRPELTIYDLYIRVEEILDHRIEWAVIQKLPAQNANSNDD